jgi:hypothetical protein
LFSKIGQPNIDEQWNTLEFTTPVACPNGFFIGVAYNGLGFVGLGTDSGINPDWPFKNNTHFYSGDLTGGSFSTFESINFKVNPMIRAEGTGGKSMGYCAPIEPVAAQGPAPVYVPSAVPVYTGDPYPQDRGGSRDQLGYKLWRFQPGEEDTPETWAQLTNNPVNAMEYNDHAWETVPEGTYRWAVRTCYHMGVESEPAFSNPLDKVYKADFTVNVLTNDLNSAAGAEVTLGTLPALTVAVNQVAFNGVPYGTYTLKVKLAGYVDYTTEVVIDGEGLSHTALLVEIIKNPSNLAVTAVECNHLLTWSHELTIGDHLKYFNVYLDNALVAEGITGNEYLFTGLALGDYVAGVAAHYGSGNSEIMTKEFNVTCLGVGEYDPTYMIYPNPASDYLTIQRTNATSATIDLYNAMGMHIASYATEEVQYEVNVANLAAGTYFIRVTEGSNSAVKSFVKK